MNVNDLIQQIEKVDNDSYLQNLIAQANARYILYNTQETNDDFPNYTLRDDKLELLAFYYLDKGASLAEIGNFDLAAISLEKGASILEYAHGAANYRVNNSNYFGLVAALSYYVSFQYSKSFILIQKVSAESIIARIIALFIQKRIRQLTVLLEEIITSEEYTDQFIVDNQKELDPDQRVYEYTIAKAINGYIVYLLTGDVQTLAHAKSLLTILKEIAEIKGDPGIWWVIRLLLLIADGFANSSLWNTLGDFFNLQNSFVRNYIHSSVYQKSSPIYELFITQRSALPKVLNDDGLGCVISIPTSSGKTKIAEIAILNCLSKNSDDKVLYIAPFRSLAFEIENTLEKTFTNLNINVSQLYGGSLFTKLDLQQVEESRVLIATPEKAKTILRSNPDLLDKIKLIVIDEGHLFGAEERFIANEIFYEEIRLFSQKNESKFLLLSAVLPNADELALWLNGNADTVYKSTWRPSDERLGILEWDGDSISLDWKNNDEGRPTYNRKFVTKVQLEPKPRERIKKYYPGNKNEAVAATAYKLRAFGSVLIFVGRKDSVFVIAEAYAKALEHSEEFQWKNLEEWKAFELASVEAYDIDNPWLAYAKKGILCHNADLYEAVRLPLERLMRTDKPHVIIATSTLGQGVNIGVSTAIFSTLQQARKPVSARDFWNIAGRAGRAFVDYEGKILVSLDLSDKSIEGRAKARKDRKSIERYFKKEQINIAKSGILRLIALLYETAIENNIPFDHLIELISNNNLESNEHLKAYDYFFDLIDDGLLSIAFFQNPDSTEVDYSLIEAAFKKSLAVIQVQQEPEITSDILISVVKARITGIIKQVGDDKFKWKSIIASSIPLKSDLYIEDKFHELIDVCDNYLSSEKTIEDKLGMLAEIDKLLIDIPCFHREREKINAADMDTIRKFWLTGIATYFIINLPLGREIICDYYNYKLPWVLNGIAKKLKASELTDQGEIFEEMAVLVELGLPTFKHAKIYQAGIRSRTSTIDLSKFFDDERGWSIKECRDEIIRGYDHFKTRVSIETAEWMRLLVHNRSRGEVVISPVSDFTYGDVHKQTQRLVPKIIKGKQYLISPNFEFAQEVIDSEIDFSEVSDHDGIYFDYNSQTELWQMKVDNPNIAIHQLFDQTKV